MIAEIRLAFARTPHPGDRFLQGSFEGSESREDAEALFGASDWSEVPVATLDAHYTALSSLSEGGFRFFLPAYLVADLDGTLRTADPLFHLTSGFHDRAHAVDLSTGTSERRTGRSAFVNPRRYGAMTWLDHARSRLSVFAREEAAAIVRYLEHRREADEHGLDREAIDAALESFWRERARTAPHQAVLERWIAEEDEFVRALGDE